MKRFFRIMLTAVVLLMLCTALVTAGGQQEKEGKVFKLGVLAPMTGHDAKSGNELKDSAVMAFEEIDYTIGDYKIELVPIDDQSDPSKATNAYSEAIERKGVQAGILNWNTAVSIAVVKMLPRYQIPHFFTMGCSQTVNDALFELPENDRFLIIKGWPIPQKLAAGYVDFLDHAVDEGIWEPEDKIVAVWGADTDWGRAVGGKMKSEFSSRGWDVVIEEYFDAKKTDFYAFCEKINHSGATILAGSGQTTVTHLIKQLRELGFEGIIIADGLGWFGEWYDMTGKASDGVLDMIPSLTTPEQIAWAEKFEERFGYRPSPSAAGIAYDESKFFIKIAERAIEKYGVLDTESIYKIGMEEVVTGKLTYTKDEGAIIMDTYATNPEDYPDPTFGPGYFFFPVIQYENGKGYNIYPENVAQKDFVPPPY